MKKKCLIAAIWVLGIAICLSLMPWSRTISVQTTAYEYAMNQTDPLRTHEVVIKGKYYSSLWKNDRFEGTLSFSGLPETMGQTAQVEFYPTSNYVAVFYRNSAGYTTGAPGYLCANRDFTKFCFQRMDETDSSPGHWNPESGHVICPAPNWDAMQIMKNEIERWKTPGGAS